MWKNGAEVLNRLMEMSTCTAVTAVDQSCCVLELDIEFLVQAMLNGQPLVI